MGKTFQLGLGQMVSSGRGKGVWGWRAGWGRSLDTGGVGTIRFRSEEEEEEVLEVRGSKTSLVGRPIGKRCTDRERRS